MCHQIAELTNWPYIDDFHGFTRSFLPFVARRVDFSFNISLDVLKTLNTIVDVACVDNGKTFIGDESSVSTVKLKINSFVEAFIALQTNCPHWIIDLDMQLYISQMSIFSVEEEAVFSKCHLKEKINHPSILDTFEISQINIWMNLRSLSSSLHYDGNHNLLYIFEGVKHVQMLSPKYTYLVYPSPYYVNTPNHSAIDLRSLDPSLYISITLVAGDCLFIPEGWWHQVTSEKCTLAVNFWFRSPLYGILQSPACSDMASYIFRIMAKTILRDTRTTSNQVEHSISHNPLQSASLALSTSIVELPYLKQIARDISKASALQMEEVWLPYARKYPSVWSKALLSMNCYQVERLTNTWEVWDEQDSSKKKECLGDGNSASDASKVGVERSFHIEQGNEENDRIELCRQIRDTNTDMNFNILQYLMNVSGPDIAQKVKNHFIQQKNLYAFKKSSRTIQNILGINEENSAHNEILKLNSKSAKKNKRRKPLRRNVHKRPKYEEVTSSSE